MDVTSNSQLLKSTLPGLSCHSCDGEGPTLRKARNRGKVAKGPKGIAHSKSSGNPWHPDHIIQNFQIQGMTDSIPRAWEV